MVRSTRPGDWKDRISGTYNGGLDHLRMNAVTNASVWRIWGAACAEWHKS